MRRQQENHEHLEVGGAQRPAMSWGQLKYGLFAHMLGATHRAASSSAKSVYSPVQNTRASILPSSFLLREVHLLQDGQQLAHHKGHGHKQRGERHACTRGVGCMRVCGQGACARAPCSQLESRAERCCCISRRQDQLHTGQQYKRTLAVASGSSRGSAAAAADGTGCLTAHGSSRTTAAQLASHWHQLNVSHASHLGRQTRWAAACRWL